MFQILKYFILIRFRKIFAKDDFTAISIFVIAIVILMYLFQNNLDQYVNYLGLFLLNITGIQLNRKDVDFLKLNSNYRIILFLEYVFLSLPILILLCLNQKFLYFLIVLIALYAITFINKAKTKVFKYPFKMFDPFWTITFRKNKLFLIIPVLGFLIFMGFKYKNPNLQYAVLVVLALVLCIPSSQREKIHYIKVSSFVGKDYLWQQVKTIAYNLIFVLVPISIVFIILKQFQMLFLIPLLLFFPFINLLFKYVFFERKIIHNMFFALFIGNLTFGFPLLFITLLYSKSIKNLKQIQNV